MGGILATNVYHYVLKAFLHVKRFYKSILFDLQPIQHNDSITRNRNIYSFHILIQFLLHVFVSREFASHEQLRTCV